ncbi:MAG: ATP-binding protein, partial [Deltaproteobacteria bacterium]|nr:ATP-binding protein [Deltaproteobacteria bacterium]
MALSFQAALEQIARKQENNFFTGQFLADLKTAFAEGGANAIRHGEALKREGKVEAALKLTSHFFEMKIADPGKGFALKKVPLPRFRSLSERGRGVFM